MPEKKSSLAVFRTTAGRVAFLTMAVIAIGFYLMLVLGGMSPYIAAFYGTALFSSLYLICFLLLYIALRPR